MMTVTVSIYDGRKAETVEEIEVRNIGHPETGDHPGDDDLRRYRWVYHPRSPVKLTVSGTVDHNQADGSMVLVNKVAEAVVEMYDDLRRPDHTSMIKPPGYQMTVTPPSAERED